jgi:hypothetical protein
MTNTTTVTYEVVKDFSPNNAVPVNISISCPGTTGTITPPTATTVVEGTPHNFVLKGHTAGDTCTVTEQVPSGYSASYHSNCSGFPLGYTVAAITCTITNTLNTTTLVVTKVDNYGGGDVDATFDVNCPPGITVTDTDPTANSGTPGDTAEFGISAFNTGTFAGNGCTITETPIPGFHFNGSNCPVANMNIGGNTTCIYDNALNAQTVRVFKDFIPDDPQGVTISQSCSNQGTGPFNITLTSADAIATDPGDYVEFTIVGFDDDVTTCTFTESTPTGTWVKNEADCANKVLDAQGSNIACTITNAASLTFTVKKDWVPDHPGNFVEFTLSCPGATVSPGPGETANPGGGINASEENPATFTVDGFTSVPTCQHLPGARHGPRVHDHEHAAVR